jgi:thiamine kinase-like enzyme
MSVPTLKTDVSARLAPTSGGGLLASDARLFDARAAAARGLDVAPEEIAELTPLKLGMTNRSFLVSVRGKRYILRIPGEGTDKLIDRKGEAASYAAIQGHSLCDNLVWLDPATGIKISEFEETARMCNPLDASDVRRCMAFLRAFHGLKLSVPHRFDLFAQIDFYESLRGGAPSRYSDYARTKANVFALRPFLDAHRRPPVLSHLDSIPDNFLFVNRQDGDKIFLIDWEYAAMQDPDIDVAMFGVYSLYNREQMNALIDAYYPEGCPPPVRTKILAYVAVCGLLWSNWCEFKHLHGVDFGEYAQWQYRYAQEYAAADYARPKPLPGVQFASTGRNSP